MIGDTAFDMEMARAAGIEGIGVAWGYHRAERLRAAGASQVVDDDGRTARPADAAARLSSGETASKHFSRVCKTGLT